jgi:hypothetical protein
MYMLKKLLLHDLQLKILKIWNDPQLIFINKINIKLIYFMIGNHPSVNSLRMHCVPTTDGKH